MKRAQKIALLSRAFSESVAQILAEIDSCPHEEKSVFSKKRGERCLDFGGSFWPRFCGAFNQNILRFSEKAVKEIQKEKNVELLPVGKKAIAYFKKKNYKTARDFFGIGDFGELEDIRWFPTF